MSKEAIINNVIIEETFEPITRLTKDLKAAAKLITKDEVRYMVGTYYKIQEYRKATGNQSLAMSKNSEPHDLINWVEGNMEHLENSIKNALDVYSMADPVGSWLRSNTGIGPVIAAGLLAHIDITKAPTAGHIWSFAGLNPNQVWAKGQKRPWNADLKTLCWKIGESFMKFSNNDNCFYGKIYKERKKYEVERNDRGDNADEAARILSAKNIGKDTEAYKALSQGKLPAAQINERAKRYAVKLFLAHFHEVAYMNEYKTKPPLPYPIAILGHAHKIDVPNPEAITADAE